MTRRASQSSRTWDPRSGRTFTPRSQVPQPASLTLCHRRPSSSLAMDFIFEGFHIQSAEAGNTINLELPLQPLQRALKSALNSISATLRLTKKDGLPILSMTITTTTSNAAPGTRSSAAAAAAAAATSVGDDPFGDDDDGIFQQEHLETSLRREHEKIITQDIPVRVLHPETVEMIMQPKVREPDVHIQLPPLLQLKAISDRFTKLALASGSAQKSPKLELSANMHGGLRLRIATDTTDICSVWSDLENPELDPAQLEGPVEEHPSTKFREEGPNRWATVRVDGKDWSRVLSVGRLEGRVIACFADDHALILYVYVPHYDDASADDSVVTYYVQSYSA
ncbi:Checkpoint protein hus1, variant 2 [Purpureocillium takamizusanense]|uniref:Checkpoint protein n=1 Tax=Purpureocillium takamizusanense TaxID=2060973 RepID=A0A9Q8QG90_9HYPO|nr:Checkpoint protein hus1, variant 2 [Purpureocillium takamizusanense]UNI18656.1 Checkpoint protein hus1, variant 2 [Purpureocillium takamizusanense]